MLKEFPFRFEKGGVTAAGPLSISTRFPIKPKRAPRVFPYVKAPSDVKGKMVKKLSILRQKVDKEASMCYLANMIRQSGIDVPIRLNSRIRKGSLFSLLLIFGFIFLVLEPAYVKPTGFCGQRLKVFVSILPQACFVEHIGKDCLDVSVMVRPGHSPATYEPTPRQMTELSKARLYFGIGVPFEETWIKRIANANPNMKIIDTRHGVSLLPMKGHPYHGKKRHYDQTQMDPHVWLSLKATKIQAQNIHKALVAEDPDNRLYYTDNLETFLHNLDRLDTRISNILKDLKTRKIIVFHPAWGYFCHDYNLEQIPIELEGKRPSAKTIAHLVEEAKSEGIKVIFVQQQFTTRSAQVVANAIGGKVVQLDPLARDYLKNMKKIADTLAGAMK